MEIADTTVEAAAVAAAEPIEVTVVEATEPITEVAVAKGIEPTAEAAVVEAVTAEPSVDVAAAEMAEPTAETAVVESVEMTEPTIEVALIAVEVVDTGEEPAAPTKEASDAAAEAAIVELTELSERLHAALTPDMAVGSVDHAVAAPSELATPRAGVAEAALEWPDAVPAEVLRQQAEDPSEPDLSSRSADAEAVVVADEPAVTIDGAVAVMDESAIVADEAVAVLGNRVR